MSDKYLDKLSALLKMAENASTEEEAASFMEKAQNLSTKYEINLAVARIHTNSKEIRETPTVETILLGDKGGRGLFIQVGLFSSIANNNNCKINIAHNSTYVVVYGFPSQIETVKALFGSLLVQMQRDSAKFSAQWKIENSEQVYNRRTGTYRRPNVLPERLSFEEGWAHRIGTRLREARTEAVKQVLEVEAPVVSVFNSGVEAPVVSVSNSGTEIALRAAELEVREFYTKTSTARGSYKGGSARGSSGSYQAGRAAANSARIGAQKALA